MTSAGQFCHNTDWFLFLQLLLGCSCIDLVTLSNAQMVGFLPLGLDPLHIRTAFVWVKWVKMGLPGPVGIVSGESLQLPWSPGPAGRWVLALRF